MNREPAPIHGIASRRRDGVQPASPESLRGSAVADDVIMPACLSSGVRRCSSHTNIMDNSQNAGDEATARRIARTRIVRGTVAIVASAVVATLIATGVAKPWPNLDIAYFAAAAVAVWGLIDIVRGLAGRRKDET